MKLLDHIRRIWTSKYSVTPWTNQQIDIHLDHKFDTSTFQIISDCDPTLLEISLVLEKNPKHQFKEAAPTDLYDLRLDAENSSIYIDLKNIASREIKSILVKKSERNFNIHHLALLQFDPPVNEWIVVYNTMEIDKNFLKELERTLQFSKDAVKHDLIKFIGLLSARNFRAALTIFEQSPHLLPLRSELQWMTERYGHQLNAHGLKKTFKFWSDAEKFNYLTNAAQMIAGLKDLTPHISLGFGGVLGAYRDNNLIAHDDDIDILVAFDKASVSHLGAALALVEKALTQYQFKVLGHFFSHLWVQASDGRMIDVFVGLIEAGERLSFYPSPRHSLQLDDVFPTQSKELCGVPLPFPSDCLSYLQKTYGPHWDKPDIGFQHAWNREEFLDIAGTRDRPIMHTRGEVASQARKRQQQQSLTTE